MEKFLKEHMRKVVSIFFILLQFIQPITATASTMTVDNSGIKVVSAKQSTNTTVSVELLILNNSTDARTDQIVLSDGLEATTIAQEKLLSKDTGEQIGTYSLNGNILSVQTDANVKSSLRAVLELKMSQIDSSISNTLTVNGVTTEVQTLSTETSKTSQTSSSEVKTLSPSKSTEPTTKDSSPSKSTESTAKDSSQKKITSTTQKSLATTGNDISQYLPVSSNGTIIDEVILTAKDSDDNPIDLDQINQNDNFYFDYRYSVPTELKDGYNIKPGDYFEFQLPKNLTYLPVPNPTEMDDYVTYTVTSGGLVRFTFTDAVNDVNGVNGYFSYSASIPKNSDAGKDIIRIDTTSGVTEIPYAVKPTGGKDIDKSGWIVDANSSGNNPSKITWTVSVNTNGNHLVNASVSDPAIKDETKKVSTSYSSITVYPQTVNLDGTVTSTGTPLVEGTDYTQESDGTITFKGDYADTYQSFKIVYQSDIDTSQIPDEGGNVTFTNTATLNNDGKSDESNPATVVAKYGVLLDKTFDGEDPNGGQKYNWHVDYNFGQKNLPAGTTLVDTLTEGQIFPGHPTLTYEDGTPVPEDDYKVTYSTDKTKMTIEFTNGLSKGVKVSYQSQVIDPIGDKGTTIGNSAESNDQTKTIEGKEVGSQGISKSLGDVDYDKKTVAWTININKAQMDMKNWSMIDHIPNGLTLNLTTVKITDTTTKEALVSGKDYNVALDKDNNLTVEFIGDLKIALKIGMF